jgi:hypothetical protein
MRIVIKNIGEIHITIAGVPKQGAKALKSLEEFKDNFVFPFKYTNKNLLVYNDEMEEFELTDYKGKKKKLKTNLLAFLFLQHMN